MKLPPLPSPAKTLDGRSTWIDLYTADQMRAYAAEAVRVARHRLTDQEIAMLQSHAPNEVLFLRPSIVRWIARAIEDAHGITKDHP